MAATSSTSSIIIHPTQFILDLEPIWGGPSKMQTYIDHEANYDLAFCEAWDIIDNHKDTPLTTPTDILAFLDKIQACALKHLPPIKLTPKGDGYYRIQGKVSGENYFALSKNINSDENGIINIIKKIWIDKDDAKLVVFHDNLQTKYWLTRDKFLFMSNLTGQVIEQITNNAENSQTTIETISKKILHYYNKGLLPNGDDSMKFCRYTDAATRHLKAVNFLVCHFTTIRAAESVTDKIKIISTTIQKLLQEHLYYDGNGRSLYLLANLLMHQNGLKPFYPRNMCMFDGNSLDRMSEEVLTGQERFTSMFGSWANLTTGLRNYHKAVKLLEKLIQVEFSTVSLFKKSFDERNFNLLLRQSAVNPKYNKLLEFLLDHRLHLNIDIFSIGEKSGNALTVAVKYNNNSAIEVLKKMGLIEI